MKLIFHHLRSTKSCEVFQYDFPAESGEKPEHITLYLKKSQLATEGIRPANGLTVTIEEAHHD